VRRHKDEAACDGLRDKVKFMPVGQFKDMDIVNDYRLLEEVTKQVDKCKRDKIKRSTRQGNEMMVAPRLQKHLQRLQREARTRNCRVRILPPHFVRRKNNTSMFDFREKIIKWHVELKFPNIDQTFNLPSVNERTKLWKLISDFVEFKCADDPTDPFQHYRAVSYGGISLYLKAEGQPAPGEASRYFYPLDMKRSLKTGLQNTRIVEHPIIYVVFSRDDHMYREEQDLILFEEDKEVAENGVSTSHDDSTAAANPTIGDVLSQTDAMQADPEAYKQYFDFYLKYYTSKYAQQGASPNLSQPLPNAFAGSAIPAGPQFPNSQNFSSNTFPSRGQLSNNTFPSRTPTTHQSQNTNPRFNNSQKYPDRSRFQGGPSRDFEPNQNFGQKFSNTVSKPPNHPPSSMFKQNLPNRDEVNRNNIESARIIQEDLKRNQISNPLGGLVAYDDSDSD